LEFLKFEIKENSISRVKVTKDFWKKQKIFITGQDKRIDLDFPDPLLEGVSGKKEAVLKEHKLCESERKLRKFDISKFVTIQPPNITDTGKQQE
jgi:hypothetical protein